MNSSYCDATQSSFVGMKMLDITKEASQRNNSAVAPPECNEQEDTGCSDCCKGLAKALKEAWVDLKDGFKNMLSFLDQTKPETQASIAERKPTLKELHDRMFDELIELRIEIDELRTSDTAEKLTTKLAELANLEDLYLNLFENFPPVGTE